MVVIVFINVLPTSDPEEEVKYFVRMVKRFGASALHLKDSEWGLIVIEYRQ